MVAGTSSSDLASGGGPAATPATGARFGTFAGVFTPTILTIFGIIMYLRAGYVVGQAGIRETLVILCISSSITFLTSLSIAAIATNTPVGGGGAYFLISRSLGAQFGGAIGLTLYLAQSLSIPFYVLGFSNILVKTIPPLAPWMGTIALVTAVAVFAVNIFGAHWAIKTQHVVMGILGLSILVFLGGAIQHFDRHLLAVNWEPGYTDRSISFWPLLAIYFPAVTDILAGVNMSGDLRNPARSLVRGTLAAVAVGFAVYAAEIILCGGSQTRDDLILRPYEALVSNALFGAGLLVVPGVFAATLSSAVASFMAAPRVLQALAGDALVPGLGIFARGSGKNNEPRVAMWATLALSLGVVHLASGPDTLGAFDRVASVITMFFLSTYGIINVAAFVESFGANPSFRPQFRLFHWTLSLAGALVCFGTMLQIDPFAAGIAVAAIVGLYTLIGRRENHAVFGDARLGFLFAVVRHSLNALGRLKAHPKNWRPKLLVLCGNMEAGRRLLEFASLLEARRGLAAVAQVLEGDSSDFVHRRAAALADMKTFLRQHQLDLFPEVVAAEDIDEGMRMLIQSYSIGALKPNTVLLGWPGDPARVAPYLRHVRDIRSLGCSVLCLLEGQSHVLNSGDRRRIDVWCRQTDNTSLMLILAYLVTRRLEWRRTRIRALHMPSPEAPWTSAPQNLRALLAKGRIAAEVTIVPPSPSFEECVAGHSADADMVLLGFQPPAPGEEGLFFGRFDALRNRLGTLVLVSASGEADLTA